MRDPRHLSGARAVVVTLPTEIDISNADRVGEELCAAFAPGVTTVIADMTDTRFCDSSGISMLVVAHQKAVTSDAELRLVAVSTAVRRALALVRIDHLLPVYPSLADALLPGPPPKTGPARLPGRWAATFPSRTRLLLLSAGCGQLAGDSWPGHSIAAIAPWPCPAGGILAATNVTRPSWIRWRYPAAGIRASADILGAIHGAQRGLLSPSWAGLGMRGR